MTGVGQECVNNLPFLRTVPHDFQHVNPLSLASLKCRREHGEQQGIVVADTLKIHQPDPLQPEAPIIITLKHSIGGNLLFSPGGEYPCPAGSEGILKVPVQSFPIPVS